MEQTAVDKRNVKLYVCFGGCLALTMLSIVLFLARGLDSNRFVDGVTWTIACLPISMAVPLYIFFDFIDHSSDPKKAQNYFPIAEDEHQKACRYGFLYSAIAVIFALICFFAFNGSKNITEAKTCMIFLVPSAPALAIYLIPTIIALNKKDQDGLSFLMSFCLLAVIAATGLIIYGMLQEQMTYLVAYIVFPIVVFILLFYNRED